MTTSENMSSIRKVLRTDHVREDRPEKNVVRGHALFVRFMERKGLGDCTRYFPESMTLGNLRTATPHELMSKYDVREVRDRERIMKIVADSHREDQSDNESDYGSSPKQSGLLSVAAAGSSISRDESSQNARISAGSHPHRDDPPQTARLLQRTLSEDVRTRLRERSSNTSLGPSSAVAAAGYLGKHLSSSQFGLNVSLNVSHHEGSNLLRMRNSSLGKSAPQLLSCMKDSGGWGSLGSSAMSIFRRQSSRLSSARHSLILPATSNLSLTLAPPANPAALLGSPLDSPRSALQHGQFQFVSNKSLIDSRRWSVASLASSSGSGTNTPANCNVLSLCSSHERLHNLPSTSTADSAKLQEQHFSSSESNPAPDEYSTEGQLSTSAGQRSSTLRPRSRSLSSPAKSPGLDSGTMLMNNVYRERFPKAVTQMEERLTQFLENNQSTEGFLLESDGAVRFVHHQVLELARDCLVKSIAKLISSSYFFELSENLERLLKDTRERSSSSSEQVTQLIKKLLMIVSRPARLLECLEFDPEEFYRLLEAAEGQAKETIKTDIPRYIISKLGLNRDPLFDLTDVSSVDSGRPDTPDTDESSESQNAIGGPLTEKQLITRLLTLKKQPGPDDFETLKLISNGAYGAVYLVRHRTSRQIFAMKKLLKSNLVLRNQVEQVYAERDILTFTDNPFVVSFYCSFETKKHLCMVLEYVEGGDCGTLLKNVGGPLSFDLARMYFAETVLALEYLHSYGIVHRDLKPDNLLITLIGHIKLTDFGLSKMGLMNLTTNLYEGSIDKDCSQFKDKQVFGTPEYIAPEVILRQGYGKPVDWWSMGIILYEFLVGCVPFFGSTPEELFSQVINEDVDWPEEEEYCPPDDAKDIIVRLLNHNPLDRLGAAGVHDVKEHIFFDGLDWDGLLRQKAEFVPHLQNDEDTSYFDTRADRYNHEIEAEDTEDDSEDIMFNSFSSCSPRYSRVYQKFDELKELENYADKIQRDQCVRKVSGDGNSEADLVGSTSANDKPTAKSDDDQVDNKQHAKLESVSNAGVNRDARDRPWEGIERVRSVGADGRTMNDMTSLVSTDPCKKTEEMRVESGGGPTRKQTTNDSAAKNESRKTEDDGADWKKSTSSLSEKPQNTFEAKANVVMPTHIPKSNQIISIFSGTRQASDGDGKKTDCDKNAKRATDGCFDASRSTTGNENSILSCSTEDRVRAEVIAKNFDTVQQKRQHLKHTSANANNLPKFSISVEDGNVNDPTQTDDRDKEEQDKLGPLRPLPPSKSAPAMPVAKELERVLLRNKSDGGKPVPKSVSASTLTLLMPPQPGDRVGPESPTFSSVHSPCSGASSRGGSPSNELLPESRLLKPGIVIRRGPRGYGFTLRAIRVYYGDSEYYTIHHLVVAVEPNSPAMEAGLSAGDLITHVNDTSVQGLLHIELVRLILTGGNQITIRTVPLSGTSIRIGNRRCASSHLDKLARQTTKSRRSIDEKRRKSSLFRKLSNRKVEQLGSPMSPHRKSLSSVDSLPNSPTQRTTTTCRPINVGGGIAWSQAASDSAHSTENSSSSSPGSSAPGSPANTITPFSRPSSLHGLKHKLAIGRTSSSSSGNRRKSWHNNPLSPLVKTPSPLATSPSRSPSPLMLVHGHPAPTLHQPGISNMTQLYNPAQPQAVVASHSQTRRSSHARPSESGSPLLRRALSPERRFSSSGCVGAAGGQPERNSSDEQRPLSAGGRSERMGAGTGRLAERLERKEGAEERKNTSGDKRFGRPSESSGNKITDAEDRSKDEKGFQREMHLRGTSSSQWMSSFGPLVINTAGGGMSDSIGGGGGRAEEVRRLVHPRCLHPPISVDAKCGVAPDKKGFRAIATSDLAVAVADHKIPDHKIPDYKIPDHKIPDHKIPDHKIPDRKILATFSLPEVDRTSAGAKPTCNVSGVNSEGVSSDARFSSATDAKESENVFGGRNPNPNDTIGSFSNPPGSAVGSKETRQSAADGGQEKEKKPTVAAAPIPVEITVRKHNSNKTGRGHPA